MVNGKDLDGINGKLLLFIMVISRVDSCQDTDTCTVKMGN